jgi:hypothetical protein
MEAIDFDNCGRIVILHKEGLDPDARLVNSDMMRSLFDVSDLPSRSAKSLMERVLMVGNRWNGRMALTPSIDAMVSEAKFGNSRAGRE